MKTIRFEIACPPNFENERMHWAVKAKAIRKAREAVWIALMASKQMPGVQEKFRFAKNPVRREVVFTRYFGGRKREMDAGGLVSACKPVLDALKIVVGHKREPMSGIVVPIYGAGLLYDDSARWVLTSYGQVNDAKRGGILEVTVR